MAVNVDIDPSMLKQAAGKTVIITGAANGIGAATANLFNANGANVVVADLEASREAATKVIETLPNPSQAVFLPLNILDWDQGKALFKEVVEKFGRIDIVIANAGIIETSPVLDMSAVDASGDPTQPLEAYKVIDVNVKGTLNTLKLALHYMEKNAGGSIVLVASTSGYIGGTGVSAYVSSKHGVVGLLRSSKGTAKEQGIRLNGVAPFFTPTAFTSAYSHLWKDTGMEANTPDGVASVIAQTALDTSKHGSCTMACASMRRELEESRRDFLPTWFGEDIVNLFQTARRFYDTLGGYPLPKSQPKV